ncbi:HlyD family efflux transporter periplasmic adaptor subunit [Ruegeria sp. HKCCD4884]|uniref:HlyD family secretion protein n=1 Tax=Ruegeria sp. HKCCD4884 TaxID=2683022 RepID=UPI0014920577|nr:efflux RND transporter periplasmic adaptor subunit [Ruegeria sp. HKCCD4884]NOD92456.1 HlyD family efflux transporter periplasmic adaptor subunit [Ruegeria sp. HKCCD4884]
MADSDHELQRPGWTVPIVAVIILLIFVWYVFSDRITPTTNNASVQGYTIAVVPEVSGYIADISIKKNTLVPTGTTLASIEKTRFENAVEAAEAELEAAGQTVGASTASVATATAALAKAQALLEETRAQSARIFTLEEKGIYAPARGDEARAAVLTAEAAVSAAESELERAREQLGSAGEDNPRLRLAVAKLADARLDLEKTDLVAPADVIVGGLKIDEGAFANAGAPLMTLISIEDQWVEAFMTENNLTRLAPGNKAEIAFDAFPGRVFEGKVKSTAWGVSSGKTVDLGDLPTASKPKGWLRDPQRFSVIIETTNYTPADSLDQPGLRYNSQATVVVYTGDNPFWNTLAKGWIRFVSYLSYLY